VPHPWRRELPDRKERPLATEERVLAMANAVGADYFAMVIMAAWCSMRFGELAGLTRDSVNVLRRKIHVHQQVVELASGKTIIKQPKSGGGRTIDIPADVVPVIKAHSADHVAPDPRAILRGPLETAPRRPAARSSAFTRR
jgi:integrase